MGHFVKVHQLQSDTGKSYLNVGRDTDMSLEVWGSTYQNPVYLALRGQNFFLFIFDNKDVAEEWLREKSGDYYNIVEIR
jgi:hypothetical protein